MYQQTFQRAVSLSLSLRDLARTAPVIAAFTVFMAATSYAQSFVLSTTGCSKKHCSQNEADAVNMVTPCPTTNSGGCQVTPATSTRNLDKYLPPGSAPNPVGGGADKSDGCSSNSFVVACRSLLNAPGTTAPCLVAFGAQNGGTYFLSSQDQVNGGCGN